MFAFAAFECGAQFHTYLGCILHISQIDMEHFLKLDGFFIHKWYGIHRMFVRFEMSVNPGSCRFIDVLA